MAGQQKHLVSLVGVGRPADGESDRSRSDHGAQPSEAEAGSPDSSAPANPLRHPPPPPASDSSNELRPAGAQEVDEEMDEGSGRIISSPAQLQELLETDRGAHRRGVGIDDRAWPRRQTDRKLDRLAASGSAVSAKMRAREAKSQERDDRIEAQPELLRSAVAELRMGAQARGEGAPSAAGRWTDFQGRGGGSGAGEQAVLLQMREPQLRSERRSA